MNNIHAYNMAGADGQTITNEKLSSWNITINQKRGYFLPDLNVDDDTVTSTSQFIREEAIFTPAAGTLSLKHIHFVPEFFMVSG